MSKYNKQYGCSTAGLSYEDHRVEGEGTCPLCGARVALNQAGKMWQHDVPEESPIREKRFPVQTCDGSWKNLAAVALGLQAKGKPKNFSKEEIKKRKKRLAKFSFTK